MRLVSIRRGIVMLMLAWAICSAFLLFFEEAPGAQMTEREFVFWKLLGAASAYGCYRAWRSLSKRGWL